MINNTEEFVTFLIEAKQHTYAGGGGPAPSSRPESHDLQYQSGDYQYMDTYLGGFRFIGEEAVWIKGKPEWGMNYYGWMLIDNIPDGFSECLKGALRQAPKNAPYRGPEIYTDGDFEYFCTWRGSLEQYTGQEYITYQGKRIYELVFHGGMVL
jgi:hypothetical protein